MPPNVSLSAVVWKTSYKYLLDFWVRGWQSSESWPKESGRQLGPRHCSEEQANASRVDAWQAVAQLFWGLSIPYFQPWFLSNTSRFPWATKGFLERCMRKVLVEVLRHALTRSPSLHGEWQGVLGMNLGVPEIRIEPARPSPLKHPQDSSCQPPHLQTTRFQTLLSCHRLLGSCREGWGTRFGL